MFYELIATVFAGFAMAGVVMLLNHATRGRLPKWAMPVAAGLAMIAATIANEYGWFGRTVDGLPDGIEVIVTHENRAAFRPWTYAVPFVDRFVALDTLSVRTHPQQPDLRLVETLFMARWAAPETLTVVLDCAGGRRAALTGQERVDENGAVADAQWVTAEEGDPLLARGCSLGAGS